MRKLALLLGILVALIAAPSAVAAPEAASVFGGDVTCGEVTADGNVAGATGQTWCGSIRAGDSITSTVSPALPTDRSTTKTFDGIPLDVNVAFPSTGSAPYPVVGVYHGYGGSKFSFKSMQRWLDQGYAVYSLSQRGFGESCGSQASRDADPTGCEKGYVHLMDIRYELRDTQLFLGKLVDQGLIEPDKIAATGGSYGGGMSLELAALKDRTMELDGTLVPWESPDGTPMSLAVASPNIPWSELTYALTPNGNNLDYIEDAGYFGRTGVMKESYVQGLSTQGFKAPAGSDPRADINGWKARLDAGEPYDDDPAIKAIVDEINTYHSAYGVDHSESPAPLLISSGFTDDLFPVNEATRFYNRTRAEFPDSPLALFFGSFGHARGQNQDNVRAALEDLEDEWVAHYLKGTGPEPASNVTTYTQTCPNGTDGAGPYTAPDWASIAPGEIRVVDDGGAQTVDADGGDTAVGAAFNPLGATACTSAPGAKEQGTADYELPPAPAGGYTVMGAATVVARITLPGDTSQIAARLVDVSPDGTTKTLVERGLWRPTNQGLQVFQLFANGWKVEEGHVLRLELLPRDAAQKTPGGFLSNYGPPVERPAVRDDRRRRPPRPGPRGPGGARRPRHRPGAEGPAGPPRRRAGARLRRSAVSIKGDLGLAGKPTVKGKRLKVEMSCDDSANYSCRKARLKLKGAPKGKHARGKNAVLARGKDIRVDAGDTKTLALKLTKRGRKVFGGRNGVGRLRTEVFIRGDSTGFTTTKRTGKVK